jgi:Integrase core domain/Chromo (CHRromatin Organisation MOdifier) domain
MEEVYFNAKTGYTGVEPLVKRSKSSRKTAIKWLEMQPAYSLHKPVRKKFTRNKVLVSHIDEQWAVDLVDLQTLAKYNDGYKYLLNCIDVFSKYAWSIPIKNKTSKSIIDAFAAILSEGRRPKKLQSDAGTEFTNKAFQKILAEECITFFTVNSEMKACVIERFNRTLKERMWRYFTKNNTYRYIDVLQEMINGYNDTKHRTIGIEPARVNTNNEPQILERAFKIEQPPNIFKFNVNDRVRISKNKGVFEKGYLPGWSEEIFIITKRLNRAPVVYTLKDQMGEMLEGIFYEQELQKANTIDDVYIVEKVIKTRKIRGKNQYFVKWRGYPAKFNSWVDSLVKL